MLLVVVAQTTGLGRKNSEAAVAPKAPPLVSVVRAELRDLPVKLTAQGHVGALVFVNNTADTDSGTIALGVGAGAELRQPLGVAIVGGLLMAQLITLFITPVLYIWFDQLGAPRARRQRAPAVAVDLR